MLLDFGMLGGIAELVLEVFHSPGGPWAVAHHLGDAPLGVLLCLLPFREYPDLVHKYCCAHWLSEEEKLVCLILVKRELGAMQRSETSGTFDPFS